MLGVAAMTLAVYFSDRLGEVLAAHTAPEATLWVENTAQVALCLAIGWLASRLLDHLLWGRVARRTGMAAPRLLVFVVRLFIVVAILAVILKAVFRYPLNGLLVSSGVAGVAVGFALQRMINDFFSGIALSMERPLRVGDWIEVDGVTGRVVQTTWRAIHLVTLSQVTVVLPNSMVAERRFINYELPYSHFRAEIPVTLEYGVAPPKAKRVLLAAIRAVDTVLPEPAPDVLLAEFGADGILYRVRFYVRSFKDKDTVTDLVATSVSKHLWQAGFNIPYPKRDVYFARMPPRDIDRKTHREAILARVDLFESLDPAELDELGHALKERKCRTGEHIVRQGDPGNSLYVVVDGLLQVSLTSNGQPRNVARLGPGEFFGEMSLLTGEPRTATVTAISDTTFYELSHEVIAPILHSRPELAQEISRHVAARRMRNEQLMAQSSPDAAAAHEKSLADELLHKIKHFFRLK